MSIYPKNMVFTSESVTEGHPDELLYGRTCAIMSHLNLVFEWYMHS